MKIIFNKYGGIKTIEDRQLLVQSSDNANYVDIYYQNDDGTFADETVNLATIAFKRSDTFEISERTCDAVREELTNKILYFRYVFLEDDLAVNGELQITVRLKQTVFDPEDETKILLIKQKTMGKFVAHIYEAVGTDLDEYNVIDGRLLSLELWQDTFEGTFYDVTQIDAKFAKEVNDRNQAIENHDESNTAHDGIRQAVANNASAISSETLSRQSADNALDERIDVLEAFKNNLGTDITEEIENAVADKADLVDGKVPREQMDDYFDDIIEGFYINPQFYSEGEENEDYLITPELGKLYVDVDTNVLYRWIGAQYEKVTGTFELTKAKIEEKLTGDITSHNHATEISNHNKSETAHTGIRNAVAEAKAIAEGKSRARVFATESALDTWLLDSENVALLQIGDNFYIEEIDKPDYWWNGTTIKELETQKVDLTDYAKTIDLPTKVSDLENDSGFLTALPTHNHDSDYYQKSETYSKSETDALVGNLQGQTQELKSITTQPSGTFTYGDQYYNSATKGMYYWNGTSWELTGAPIAGVIYSFNGILYFWDESTLNLIQIGGGVDLSNYYTKTEVDNAIDTAILGLLGGES